MLNNIEDLKELRDKLLSTWRIERKQRQFERELKDVYRTKKKTSPLLYLFLLFPIICGIILFFAYGGKVEITLEPKKQVETKPVVIVPTKPEQETVIKAEIPVEKPIVVTEVEPILEKLAVPVELEPEPEIILEPEEVILDIPKVEITKASTLVYSIESELGDVIATLEKGSVLELIDEIKGWKKVRYVDRKIGWIKTGDGISVTGKKINTIFATKIEIEVKSSLILAKEFLEDWVFRTENRDVEKYIKLYDNEFTGQGRDIVAWKARKKGIFKNARFILVGVKNIKILEETDTTLKVGFVQYYNNSDSLKTTNNKVLVLRKTENGYRILREYLQ